MKKIKMLLSFEEELDTYLLLPNKLVTKLHGFLMGEIDSEYAQFLHNQTINPYSMSLKRLPKSQTQFEWEINLLTEDAIEQIGAVILDEQLVSVSLELAGDKRVFRILSTQCEQLTEQMMSDLFYSHTPVSQLTIEFQSPTAFKQNGNYVIVPDLRLIIQSMVMKHQSITGAQGVVDAEFVDGLVKYTKIQQYQLKTQFIQVHGVRIAGFVGTIQLRLFGRETLKHYLMMLFKFAEYSGIGIKSSMGMGSIQVSNLK